MNFIFISAKFEPIFNLIQINNLCGAIFV